MKKILTIILLLLLAGVTYYFFTKTKTSDYLNIIGCYEAGADEDVYTMTIENVSSDGDISGYLEFDNYQIDSSQGPFEGVYDGKHIYAEYQFESEGMESVMEVAFERQGDDFVRGVGEDGTMFTNTEMISYESNDLSFFEKVPCVER